MSASSQRTWLGGVLFLAVVGGVGWWWYQREQPVDMVRAIELNNRGIALMEQFKYPEAAATFEEIVKLAPSWLPGRINLGIALLNHHESQASQKAAIDIFERVLQDDPKSNHADFCLGILRNYLAKELQNAIQHFQRVTERDPGDPHAWLFMGNLLNQTDEPERAKECYEKVVALDPYIPGSFNALQLLYRRLGDDKKANELLERFKELQQSKWISHADYKYGEMGKYAEVIGRNPRDKSPATGPLPNFVRDDKLKVQLGKETRWATPADLGAGPEGDLRRSVRKRFGGTIAVFDCNRDGKLDLFLASAVVRGGKLADLLLLNQGDSTYRDVSAEAGLDGLPASFGCCVADFDNDELPDLLLTGVSGVRLLRNGGGVRFQDVTKTAGLDQITGVCLGAAFADIDQDSDLDLLIGQIGPNVPRALAFLQNAARDADEGGLLAFVNVGEAPANSKPEQPLPLNPRFQRSKVIDLGRRAVCNIAVTDLDGDRDIDLLIFADGPPPSAILNDRLLKFHSQDVLKGPIATKIWTWNGAAILDVDREDRSDLFVVGPGQKPMLLVHGKAGTDDWFTDGATNAPPMIQAQAVDLDLDGWTDIVGLSEERLPVLLHNEAAKLVHVKEGIGASGDWPKDIAAVIAGDFDSRCRYDVLLWSETEGLRLFRNQGNGNQALPVLLAGKRQVDPAMRNNSDGIGARIGVQARDHWTCAEWATFHGGIGQSRQLYLFGLGKHAQADFVSLRWPDGVWQAELNFPACQLATINETNRKQTSCPLLFTWNGKQFEFITDFLGAGSIGEPLPQGGHRQPRAEESVKIEAEQLVPKDGRYVLKFAEPMDEVTYLDRLRLVVVDHPADVRVYPDERFPTETRPATQDLLVISSASQIFPKHAKDHRGRDVTQTLRHWDRHTADGFAKRSWIGFAEEHFVELDFGDQLAKFAPLTPNPSPQRGEGRVDRLGLFLAGWTDYPYPESIWAATQAGHSLLSPVLERQGDDGKWHVLRDDLSFPAGMPRMMTYDISGLATGPACKLRIRTNMHVYWDQIFVAPLTERIPQGIEKAASVRLKTLDVLDARLEHRGCMQEYSPDGKQPTLYAYDKLDKVPVTRQAGRLTKFGDVAELLTERDDRFVIFGPGDELTVTFAANKLPPLSAGWKRSFVLRTWGYCKDASPWTATGDTIEPLPFHGMSNFPYGPGERYPRTPLHQEYLTHCQTRQIGK